MTGGGGVCGDNGCWCIASGTAIGWNRGRIEYVYKIVGKFSGEIQKKQSFIYCACVSSCRPLCSIYSQPGNTNCREETPFSSRFHR